MPVDCLTALMMCDMKTSDGKVGCWLFYVEYNFRKVSKRLSDNFLRLTLYILTKKSSKFFDS